MFKALRRDKAFYRSFASLTVPMILQSLISASLGLVDTFMVGTLGQDAMAGVSMSNTPLFVSMLIIFGLQGGGSILISQYWGKRDMHTINRIMGTSWVLGVAMSFIPATIIFIFPYQVMGLVSNNATLVAIAVRYGRIVVYSYVINAFTSVYVSAMRCCENPRFGTVVTSTGMVTNVIFNWLLIFGKFGLPRLGIEGAAWGTLIARVVEALVVIGYMIFAKNKVITLEPRYLFSFNKELSKDFLKYSLPVMANQAAYGFGISLFTVIYGHMANSSDIVAAHSLAGSVERILTVTMFSISGATSILIGKSLGSGQDREEVSALAKTLYSIAVLIGICSGIILLVGLATFIPPLVYPYFGLTDGATRTATLMMGMMSFFLPLRAYNATVIGGVLRGGGDVTYALIADCGAMYVWSLPVTALLALVFKLDIAIVYPAVLSEEILKLLVARFRYRSGKWGRNLTRDIA